MFLTSTTVQQFKDQFPATTSHNKVSPSMKPVIMKLEDNWGTQTLMNLTKLTCKLLHVPGSHLHLLQLGVEDGCVAVHWLCPISMIFNLEEAITAAADPLYTEGVQQIFIDCKSVLNFAVTGKGITPPITLYNKTKMSKYTTCLFSEFNFIIDLHPIIVQTLNIHA